MTTGAAEGRVEIPVANSEYSGQKPRMAETGAANVTGRKANSWPEAETGLIEQIVSRGNLMAAYSRVVSNKGAPGVDGMPVTVLKAYLQTEWPRIEEELLVGKYIPQPVRKVEIPKPGGGTRTLGIPTVLDRLIQQATHQVLNPLFDPGFSENSYGFRPGRSAHQAVKAAASYVASGFRWVVDIRSGEIFRPRPTRHAHGARQTQSRRPADTIAHRQLPKGGNARRGLISARHEGTPQGGPLSPLLSNILLDELNKELERRGHRFCPYADDANIYVATKASGERVMASVARYLSERLKLTVNQNKNAVDRPWKRTFLSYSMTWHRKPRLKVADKAIDRLKHNLRGIFRRGRGKNIRKVVEEAVPKIRGGVNYFRHAEVKGIFEELDGWIRRKLRCILWKQWKRPFTRAKNLMRMGLSRATAWKSATNGRGTWWNSGASHMQIVLPKSFFDKQGLVSLMDQHHRLQHAS